MILNCFDKIVRILKKHGIDKETGLALCPVLVKLESIGDLMFTPSAYSCLDLLKAMKILTSDTDVYIYTTSKSIREEVRIDNRAILLAQLFEWFDPEPDADTDEHDEDGYPVSKHFLSINNYQYMQNWIDERIKVATLIQKMVKDLSGRNRNGGCVPFMGLVSQRLIDVLNERNVPFKNISAKRAFVFDMVTLFHPREEVTINEKQRAVSQWIGAYLGLPEGVKQEAIAHFHIPEVSKVDESLFYSSWESVPLHN